MRCPRPTAAVLAVLCAPACFHDGGPSAGATADATTAATTGAAATTADLDTTTAGSSSTAPATTGAASDETTDDATSTATTGELPQPCGAAHLQVLALVENAELVAPMLLDMSQSGEGKVASSAVAEEGTVDFTVDLSCSDTYTIWARVHDALPGSQFDDPDAFYARTDADPEVPWFYGCATARLDAGWSWQRVRDTPSCEDATDWTPVLAAGQHHVVLRNREAAAMGNRAFIARILVTNDPDYVPTSE